MDDLLPLVDYELYLDGKAAPDGEFAPPWKINSVWIEEAINAPFRASVDIEVEGDVTSDSLLGADAELKIFRGNNDPQRLFGIVSHIHDLGYADHHLHLRMQISSAFELLQQEVGSRIWQGESVTAIVANILGACLKTYGRTLVVDGLSRGQQPREYCVQYRESVFDFASRLLEEEGISYAFIHDAEKGHEVLTLVDSNAQYPAAAPRPIPIVSVAPDNLPFESVQDVSWERALTSTASLRRDFDWKDPTQLLTASKAGEDERGRVRRIYAHTGRRFARDDLAERSADLCAAAMVNGSVCHARSNATILRAGHKFKLSGHVRPGLDQEYIVVAIRHGGQPSGGEQYSNDFECIPLSVEVRPAQTTPKPRVHGPHTAIVTGREEIDTDKHGRIKVQFSWDEKPKYKETSSCWVRCAHAWAGNEWGVQFIPRRGMEVIVEYIDGNPDRPLVTGCVYNGANSASFDVPGTKTQSGWRTQSSPNGGGFNELRFEDAKDHEEIFIRAQKDLRTVVQAAESRSVGASRDTTITKNDTLVVSEGDVEVTLEKGSRKTEITEGDDELTIKQGGSTKKAPNGTETLEAKDVVMKGSSSFTLECGGSKIVMTPGQIEITSALIKLN